LPEVNAMGRQVGDVETKRDEDVNRPHRQAARQHLDQVAELHLSISNGSQHHFSRRLRRRFRSQGTRDPLG